MNPAGWSRGQGVVEMIWLYFKDIGEILEWLQNEGMEEKAEQVLDFHEHFFDDDDNVICLGYLMLEDEGKIAIEAISLFGGRKPEIRMVDVEEWLKAYLGR
jgi:hypothetical protein